MLNEIKKEFDDATEIKQYSKRQLLAALDCHWQGSRAGCKTRYCLFLLSCDWRSEHDTLEEITKRRQILHKRICKAIEAGFCIGYLDNIESWEKEELGTNFWISRFNFHLHFLILLHDKHEGYDKNTWYQVYRRFTNGIRSYEDEKISAATPIGPFAKYHLAYIVTYIMKRSHKHTPNMFGCINKEFIDTWIAIHDSNPLAERVNLGKEVPNPTIASNASNWDNGERLCMEILSNWFARLDVTWNHTSKPEYKIDNMKYDLESLEILFYEDELMRPFFYLIPRIIKKLRKPNKGFTRFRKI